MHVKSDGRRDKTGDRMRERSDTRSSVAAGWSCRGETLRLYQHFIRPEGHDVIQAMAAMQHPMRLTKCKSQKNFTGVEFKDGFLPQLICHQSPNNFFSR